ncbi:MAG TPA: serine protease, partial [Vicinamibacterales bacterium]|nr:serine protease [Vicinamibacterales bacterium]
MLRVVAFASLALAANQGDATQGTSVLHIKISVVDADQRPEPVARHALLVSDNPSTTVPLRVVTRPDGTAEVRLRPGSYTVESDRPAVLRGRAYDWTQIVDIVAGRDTTLELTAANAEVGPAAAAMEATATPAEERPAASLLAKWQGSVVALWTEHRHSAGFIVSGTGLVATSQSGIGDATSVEVQLSPTEKVAGRVLATDPEHDVAVVQIDPAAMTSAQPVPLACGAAVVTTVASTQDLVTIEVPFLGVKSATSGGVVALGADVIDTDFALAASSAGGPVFAGDGPAVGLTSMPDTDAAIGPVDRRRASAQVRVVRAPAICAAVASAEKSLAAAAPPSAARLPVEPSKALPVEPASARGFSLSPYASSSSDFDILFITPALLASAESQQGRTGGANDTLSGLRAVTDFGEWSEYVSQSPPVLFIRATPKQAESFWMKFARGAASTQGASIPPIKHLGPGFSRMRVLCGKTEIAPVHPFRIRARVSASDAVDEGFYAFDPMAIGPQCGTVSLVLSSVKDPAKTETRVIDPAVIARVWQDFAAYREKSPLPRPAARETAPLESARTRRRGFRGAPFSSARAGRRFWILDDVSPHWQIRAVKADTAPVHFFAPSPASRMRWDNT